MTKNLARIALLAPLVAMLSLSACDMLTSTDKRVARATAALEAGKLDSALKDARAVVEKEKGNAAAWLLLARIGLKQGDAESALSDLERARAAGAKPDVLLPVRDEALLQAQRFEDVLDDVEGTAPTSAHQVAVATAQIALNRRQEAQLTLDEVLAKEPGNVEGHLLQIRFLLADGKIAEARTAIDQLLVQAPDTARALVMKAQLALAAGDTAGALASFTRAQTLAAQLTVRDQLGLLGTLAETQLQVGDTAAAAQWQARLQQRAPQLPLTQLLSARVALAKGDAPAAVATLQRLLAAQPQLLPARLMLGAALMDQGATEQAREHLARVVAEQPGDLGARKLLAQLYMSQGDVREASRVMATGSEGATNDPTADWLRSSILAVSGQNADALLLLEQAGRAAPGNIPLQLDLARAYLHAGRSADATRVLKSIPPQQAGKAGKQLAVLTQINGQNLAAARQTLARLVTENSRDAQTLLYIAQLQSQFGDLDASAAAFRSALAVEPASLDAHLGLAAIAQLRSDPATLEAELKKAVAAGPGDEKAYLGLAALAVQRDKTADARRALEQAIGAVPAAVQSRLALAALSLRSKDSDRARALLTQAVEVSRDKGATLISVGDVYLQASLPAEALLQYQEAAKRGNRAALLKVATAQFAMNQAEQARSSLEAAAASHPEWPEPVAILLSLDTSERRFDRALQRIERLRKAGASEAVSEELRGSVLISQGNAVEAERAYARAYQLQPQAGVALKLFNARRAAKNAQPQAVLRQWLERQPTDQRVRTVLAQHLQASGDLPGAVAEYELAVRETPSPELLNNLAWAYQLAKDPRALATAKRAYDAAPDLPTIADTYGWVLLENGKAKEALPILEMAAKAMPGNADVQAHYARAKTATEK